VVAAETAITMTRQRPAAPVTDTAVPEPPAGLNGHADRGSELFAGDLARGDVPGARRIRRKMHLAQPRAQQGPGVAERARG
jgi:hypothetical protein